MHPIELFVGPAILINAIGRAGYRLMLGRAAILTARQKALPKSPRQMDEG
jgi:hypothetical protein